MPPVDPSPEPAGEVLDVVRRGDDFEVRVPQNGLISVPLVGEVSVAGYSVQQVELLLERKRGILGSNLRIKLVFFYLALVLLPALILFTGSAKVIKDTVEAILTRAGIVNGRAMVECLEALDRLGRDSRLR